MTIFEFRLRGTHVWIVKGYALYVNGTLLKRSRFLFPLLVRGLVYVLVVCCFRI